MPPRIKICCISSVEEAKLAIEWGASALGLVSEMPSGPGVIEEERIAEIVKTLPEGIRSFLLTSKQEPEAIIGQQQRTGVNTLQLVDSMTVEAYGKLRAALPNVHLVQVIHVRDESAMEEALTVAPYVDAILLDSGNPTLAVKELGGTGRVHDWRLSRMIVEAVPVPVYLAGGLNAQNVREAIERVQPFGLDICSGVRTDGRLDETKLSAYIRNVHQLNEV